MIQRSYDENTSGNCNSHHYSSSRAICIPITTLGELMLPIKYYVVLDEFDTLEDARRMLYSMVDYTPRQCSVLSSTRCIFVPKDNAHSTLESKSDKPPEDFNGPIKSGYIKIENNQFISLIKGLTCTSPFSIESD